MTALEAGECVVCGEPYQPGDQIGLLLDGWADIDCWAIVMEPTC